jgi:hypothetical protein
MQTAGLFGPQQAGQGQAEGTERANLEHPAAAEPVTEMASGSGRAEDAKHGRCPWLRPVGRDRQEVNGWGELGQERRFAGKAREGRRLVQSAETAVNLPKFPARVNSKTGGMVDVPGNCEHSVLEGSLAITNATCVGNKSLRRENAHKFAPGWVEGCERL